jgi:hypothetical protein
MIRQDQKSWEKGRADGALGAPSLEGKAEHAKRPRLRVVEIDHD